MRNKWRFLLLALVVVFAVTLSASAATAKSKATVTISFLANTENRLVWDVLLGNFARVYPEIHVEPTYIPSVQQQTLLLTQFQGGNPPDMFVTNVGASTPTAIYAFGAQGKLLDLTGAPWFKRVPAFARKYVEVKGRVYGFPGVFIPQGLMYNRDLFRQLGLSIPTRFSELLALCPKIKSAGKIPIALGAASASGPINMLVVLGTSFVYGKDPDWTIKRIQHKSTFAGSPLWQRTLQAIVQMKDAGCFQPAPEGTTNIAENTLVATGQAAMMFASATQSAPIKAINPNVNLGLFAFPGDDPKDTVVAVGNGVSTVVGSKTTSHPAEVKTFINFIARPKQNSLYAKVVGSIGEYDLLKGKLPDLVKEMSKNLTTPGKSIFPYVVAWPRPDKGLMIPNFYLQVPGLFTGQRTPDQILQFMDALWDKP